MMMTVLQYILYLAVLVVLAIPLGAYMKKVMFGEKTFLSGILNPCENLVYKVMHIKKDEEMTWKKYAVCAVLFSCAGFFFLFLLQLMQGVLPGNPQHLPGVNWDLAFNTTASFVTNTNWQAYSGECTLSYLTQALGLTVQNFVSAATGIAVLFAMIRGFVKVKSEGLGSFWVDMTRIVIHILLPVNLVIAMLLVGGGVIQNLKGAQTVSLVEPVAVNAEGEVLEDADIDTETGIVTVNGQTVPDAAQLSSLADETPEGRSVVILAKEQFGIRGRSLQDKGMEFIPFTAVTRMSGVDYDGNEIRKGAADAIKEYVIKNGGTYSKECEDVVQSIASKGGTPLVVSKNHRVLGVIYLKDIIKQGVKEKFADLRKMGIKTIMITGDNPVTAAAIAAEAGVDDFLAEATPEGKLNMIRDFQKKGHLVAMTGDGTNDAPALAQADVAVAMNSGTQAAKEAGNMVDLDSSPTKLIDIVRIGKQLLMTRGSLTTFSIANDVAKYFAIIPALFMGLYPGLSSLNIMHLYSPQSAVLSAIIYNALIIIALIPLALKGVKYREVSAGQLLSRNLLVYGLGGLAAPFIFVKLIDILLVFAGLV